MTELRYTLSQVLKELLQKASGLHGRRYRDVPTYRVAEFIEDFTPLRNLSAFHRLEAEVRQVIDSQGWSKIR